MHLLKGDWKANPKLEIEINIVRNSTMKHIHCKLECANSLESQRCCFGRSNLDTFKWPGLDFCSSIDQRRDFLYSFSVSDIMFSIFTYTTTQNETLSKQGLRSMKNLKKHRKSSSFECRKKTVSVLSRVSV